MSLPCIDTYLEPISEQNPCGDDSRYEFCYEVMEVEVKKFGSLFGETVDWKIVESNASDVLINYSKDLKATCYLIRAWIEDMPVTGILNGLTLLNKTLETFHSELFPKRKRGRDGALEWLVSQLELVIPKLEIGSEDLPAVTSAITLSQDVHFKISEYFEDSDVSFFSVRDALTTVSNRVEVSDDEPCPEPAAVPTAVQEVVETAPIKVDTPEEAVVPTPQPKVVKKEVAPQVDFVTDFSSSSEARKTLERTAEYLFTISLANPLPYRILRFVTWQEVDELPPVTSGSKTPLRLPISADQCAEYRDAIKNKQCNELVKKLEKSLMNSPFWLTGHKLQFDMLEHLGHHEAAQAILQETQSIIQRLPGLELLSFSDECPFADEETQKWLQVQLAKKAMPSESVLDEIEFEEITVANIGDVIFQISESLNNGVSGRNDFINHLQLTQVYQRAGLYQMCLPHLEVIWPSRSEMNLACWEPQLCRQFDDLALSVLHHLYGKAEMMPPKYQMWLETINKQ